MKGDLDRTDYEILAALQKNARISNKELADHVGLAPSSCHQRVRRLRDSGVIRGTSTALDPDAIGITLQVMVAIQVRDHAPVKHELLLSTLRGLEEVVAIYQTGGTTDLLVQLAVRDATHLRELVHGTITSHPMVDRVETMILFDYEWRSLPLFSASEGS